MTEARERAKLKLTADSARILEAVPMPLLVIGADRSVVAANQGCRDLFGDAPVGKPLAMLVRHPDALDAVERAIAAGAPVEQEFFVAGAKPRSYMLGVGPIAAPAPGAILSFHETTAAMQTERMRADFVANVSHELKTPLASLIGFIETLQGVAFSDAEARKRFLAIMSREADRMSRLIDDLLSLSRIERDEHVAPEKVADLGAIISDVAATLAVRADDFGIEIQNTIDEAALDVIGDGDQLAQIFQNILDNALKYGRDGGVVTITSSRAARLAETGGPGVCIAITDHGDGIARQHMPRLTERFYRVDTARSRAMGGTGLGLAIVKHIVSRHRGTFAIESEVGSGTTVTVCLPAGHALPS